MTLNEKAGPSRLCFQSNCRQFAVQTALGHCFIAPQIFCVLNQSIHHSQQFISITKRTVGYTFWNYGSDHAINIWWPVRIILFLWYLTRKGEHHYCIYIDIYFLERSKINAISVLFCFLLSNIMSFIMLVSIIFTLPSKKLKMSFTYHVWLSKRWLLFQKWHTLGTVKKTEVWKVK